MCGLFRKNFRVLLVRERSFQGNIPGSRLRPPLAATPIHELRVKQSIHRENHVAHICGDCLSNKLAGPLVPREFKQY
jgi:hypothetical protein